MSTILIHLAQKIDEACKDIERDLALGKASEIGEYKFACGRYRGLLTAKDIIIETAQKLEEDDD
jgi:hypothetical protein